LALKFFNSTTSSHVILSRVFCGEGSMQLAGSTGAAPEFIGPSRQKSAAQDDTVRGPT